MPVGTNKKERGNLAVEGAIVFPVIILLVFGTLDFGRVTERYFALSRVAYEGARAGSTLAGLGEGDYQRICPGATPVLYPCMQSIDNTHYELQDKIGSLLTANGFSDLSRLDIRTSYSPAMGGNSTMNAGSNYVTVDIRVPVPLVTSIFGNELFLHVAATAPYLYRTS